MKYQLKYGTLYVPSSGEVFSGAYYFGVDDTGVYSLLRLPNDSQYRIIKGDTTPKIVQGKTCNGEPIIDVSNGYAFKAMNYRGLVIHRTVAEPYYSCDDQVSGWYSLSTLPTLQTPVTARDLLDNSKTIEVEAEGTELVQDSSLGVISFDGFDSMQAAGLYKPVPGSKDTDPIIIGDVIEYDGYARILFKYNKETGKYEAARYAYGSNLDDAGDIKYIRDSEFNYIACFGCDHYITDKPYRAVWGSTDYEINPSEITGAGSAIRKFSVYEKRDIVEITKEYDDFPTIALGKYIRTVKHDASYINFKKENSESITLERMNSSNPSVWIVRQDVGGRKIDIARTSLPPNHTRAIKIYAIQNNAVNKRIYATVGRVVTDSRFTKVKDFDEATFSVAGMHASPASSPFALNYAAVGGPIWMTQK